MVESRTRIQKIVAGGWLPPKSASKPVAARIQPDAPAQFSVGHFAVDDLFAARHPVDLTRLDSVELHLDHCNRGVGTGACGPDTLPQYRAGGGRYRFAWRMRGYHCEVWQPADLARERDNRA